ncbi:pilin [Patescibacteria group bacterium]|nr:pilin [Patescibacteria group bacterium]
MKKILYTICLISTIGLILTPIFFVQAEEIDTYANELKTQLDAVAGEKGADYGDGQDPRAIIVYVIQISLSVLGIIFIVYVFYAGATWLTSGGDEEKIKNAKKTLTYAILGVVIVFSAYSITLFVKRYLDIAGSAGPEGVGYFQAQWGIEQDMSDFYDPDPLGGSGFVPGYDFISPDSNYSSWK